MLCAFENYIRNENVLGTYTSILFYKLTLVFLQLFALIKERMFWLYKLLLHKVIHWYQQNHADG